MKLSEVESQYQSAVRSYCKRNGHSLRGLAVEPGIRKDGLQDGYLLRLADGTEMAAYEWGSAIRFRQVA